MLFRLTDRLYRAASATAFYEAALDAILEALGCRRAAILLFDGEGVIRFVAARGLSDAYRTAATGHSPWRLGAAEPEPIFVCDVAAWDVEPALGQALAAEGIGALAFIPLTAGGGVIGKFMAYHDGPHEFDRDEAEFALTIARQLGFGLERLRAEQSLREERELLQTMFDRIPAMITVYDGNTRILRLNAEFERLTGYRAAEVSGASLMQSCYPDPGRRAEAAAFMELCRDGWLDLPLTCRDGRMIETSWANIRLSDGRQVGIGFDITQRKQTEAALRRQSERLAALDRVARSLAQDLDLDRIAQVATEAAAELGGATDGAFLYRPEDDPEGQGEDVVLLYALSGGPRSIFAGQTAPSLTPLLAETFRSGRAVRSDDIRSDHRYADMAPYCGKPGSHLDIVSYLAVPVVASSGAVHGAMLFGHPEPGVFTQEAEDIVTAVAGLTALAIDNARLLASARNEATRRRASEAAARRLAAIVESSDDAIVSLDTEGRITHWNAGAVQLFGYEVEEIIGQSILRLVPQERQGEEPQILTRVLSGEHVAHYETVRRRKDGRIVDISLTISPIRDAADRIVGASKIARDITERRRAEERQVLLLREMDHRIKNLFTLAGSMVGLSARTAQNPRALAEAVQQRLAALARAHALTVPQAAPGGAAAGPGLHDLMRIIFAPYEQASRPRFAISGDDVALSGQAATSLALLLHEFATNAAKYGALSADGGMVEIMTRACEGTVNVLWHESGGPPVRPMAAKGFGSVLAEATIAGQLEGEFVRDWRPEGLEIRIRIARDRLTRER